MEVYFATRELAGRLGSARGRIGEFGVEVAEHIDLRLQQLHAAPTLEHVRSLPGRCHELDADLGGHLAIDVRRSFRLVFRPQVPDRPDPHTGVLDWATVDSIVITDIDDYS